MEVPQLRDAIVNMTGQVHASVAIGSKGRAATVKITSEPHNKVLSNEVEFLLKHQTQYSPSCGGRSVEFTFTYVVEGQETDKLAWKVVFQPPTRYTIVSRPVRPSIEYAPK
jgi:hypothetical protein